MASAGVLYVWSLRELSRAMPRSRDAGIHRPDAGEPLDALDAGGGARRQPQPAVGREALLRGEVVDVDLGRVDQRSPPAADVASTATMPVGAVGPAQRHRHAGRRLVVGEGVEVDVAAPHAARGGCRSPTR